MTIYKVEVYNEDKQTKLVLTYKATFFNIAIYRLKF